jgi:hypothetical protein
MQYGKTIILSFAFKQFDKDGMHIKRLKFTGAKKIKNIFPSVEK